MNELNIDALTKQHSMVRTRYISFLSIPSS